MLTDYEEEQLAGLERELKRENLLLLARFRQLQIDRRTLITALQSIENLSDDAKVLLCCRLALGDVEKVPDLSGQKFAAQMARDAFKHGRV